MIVSSVRLVLMAHKTEPRTNIAMLANRTGRTPNFPTNQADTGMKQTIATI